MEDQTIEDIHTRPKSKTLFDRVRANILEGAFPPGHWLKQAELEERYSASRSEVRAVLSTLSERGIVEYVTNRGFRVFNRSPREIDEIIEVIAALEVAAAPGMVANVDSAAIEELSDLARRFEDMILSGSHADLRLLNYRFHSRLNALGGNALLMRTVQNLRECCISGPFGRYTTYLGLRESSDEHFEIIDALRERQTEQLAALLRAHSSHRT